MGRRKKESYIQESTGEEERRIYLNAGEIESEIQKLEQKMESVDKRTKDFDVLKSELNNLFNLYNKEVGFKAYKHL